MRRLVLLLLGAALLATACAIPRVTIEKRPDGIYHLACKTKLSECLEQASKVCGYNRYAVLRAFDDRDVKGDPTVSPDKFASSEAFVRCGFEHVWGKENKQLLDEPLCPAPATPAALATPAAPLRVCTPGATQACVGAAGCRGGQACEADGTRFSPCDCGPAPAPSSAPANPPRL